MSDRLFDLTGRVAIITGGAGFLGRKHAEVIARAGGIPVLADIAGANPEAAARECAEHHGGQALGWVADITKPEQVQALVKEVLERFRRVDILINNAANNPKVESPSSVSWTRLENFPLDVWEADLSVGLTGAFLCSRIIGREMALRGKGVIVNVASDLAVIAPDQRLYRQEGVADDLQPVKPVSYSVVKTGLIGLTRYLATYWAGHGVLPSPTPGSPR